MKKIIITSILLSFFSIFVGYGQFFKGGVRLGFTGSQISGDELSGFHKFGGYSGLYVNFAFPNNTRWKLQAELNFIMKGSSRFLRSNKDGEITGQQYILTMLYTETPVLIKFSPVPYLELELGPAFNFLFYEQENDSNGKMPSRQPFRIFELAGIAGVSVFFKEHYGINFRFSNSILPVRIPGANYSNYKMTKKQFNSTLAFSLYYQF